MPLLLRVAVTGVEEAGFSAVLVFSEDFFPSPDLSVGLFLASTRCESFFGLEVFLFTSAFLLSLFDFWGSVLFSDFFLPAGIFVAGSFPGFASVFGGAVACFALFASACVAFSASALPDGRWLDFATFSELPATGFPCTVFGSLAESGAVCGRWTVSEAFEVSAVLGDC